MKKIYGIGIVVVLALTLALFAKQVKASDYDWHFIEDGAVIMAHDWPFKETIVVVGCFPDGLTLALTNGFDMGKDVKVTYESENFKQSVVMEQQDDFVYASFDYQTNVKIFDDMVKNSQHIFVTLTIVNSEEKSYAIALNVLNFPEIFSRLNCVN